MNSKLTLLLIVVAMAVSTRFTSAQNTPQVPKYDFATESTFKGTIVSVSERVCPVSGGMGFHFVMKWQEGTTIEVHVATSKFIKDYEVTLHPGDQVEVVGSRVKFEGVDTIFAREITRGSETFMFRDKTGKVAW